MDVGLAEGDLVLAAGRADAGIGVWDLQTQTFIASYKDNVSGRNSTAVIGRDFLAAAQSGKSGALHVWSWQKDAVHLRSWSPQVLSSIACSPDGTYLAGGSEQGYAYIWATASGELLCSWPAHYRSVTKLVFTAESSTLVSSGADAVISSWLLMDLLDAGGQPSWSARPTPLNTLSQHTLPVTDLCLGSTPSNTVLVSVSADQSCKIWNLATGKLLRSIALSTPLLAAALDPWEQTVFVGATDGQIFQVPLLPKQNSSGGPSSPAGAKLEERGIHLLTGHTGGVNSLAISSCGYHLVSGSEDSTIRVWDINSLQMLRQIQAKGPVSSLLVLPGHLRSRMGSRASDSGKRQAERCQLIAPLSKHSQQSSNSGSAHSAAGVTIDGTQAYRGIITCSGLMDTGGGVSTIFEPAAADPREVIELDTENKELKEQVKAAASTIQELRAANAQLHAFIVEDH